jgi:hypothetical protein
MMQIIFVIIGMYYITADIVQEPQPQDEQTQERSTP